MRLFTLLFRLLLGGLFVGHGTQKLFGWFGGQGLEQTGEFFEEKLNLEPGRRNAAAAGLSEAGGGALLVLGLATPVASAAIIGAMATAIKTVHAPNGPWVTNSGWEYNALIIAALTLLTEQGPGELSLDHALGIDVSGPGVAVLALAAGLGGAATNLKAADAL